MAVKKSNETFQVYAKITLDTAIGVSANSLEEALGIARNYTIHDFVTILGEHNDSDTKITGVYSSEF